MRRLDSASMQVRRWGRALITIQRVDRAGWESLDLVSRWLVAARASVLVITFISVAIAGLLAIRAGRFDPTLWFLAAVALLLAHATNNLLNDLTDYLKGVDRNNYFRAIYGPHALEHKLLSIRGLLGYAAFSGLIAIAIGAYIVSVRGPFALALLLAGAFFVLFYTWPLKYIGLGEIAVILVWGPLMIGGTYFVVTGVWDWDVVLVGLPYAIGATNAFDYPLSSRFDETDSYVIFDNVFVPWERVFIYRNLEVSRDQWWKTPSHLYGNHQAQVRYATKLRFMIGLAKRMNEMTGNEANPSVQTVMGELAAFVSIVESMLLAHETVAPIENGVLWPSKMTLYSVMALQSEFNGRMLETIRELAGAAMITQPSSLKDFENPEIARDIARYMGSATSDARSRTQFMRLAWDFIGSEFGSRHAQYEKFYGGASFVVKQNVYRNYDFKRATALVDAALNLPEVEES